MQRAANLAMYRLRIDGIHGVHLKGQTEAPGFCILFVF